MQLQSAPYTSNLADFVKSLETGFISADISNPDNNEQIEKLTDFISAIEKNVGKNAVKNLLPIQPGDVPATFADTKLLKYLTGFVPSTGIDEGVAKFVVWYRQFFDK